MINIPFIKDKIYLDGAATQPLPQSVIDDMTALNMIYASGLNIDYNEKQHNAYDDAVQTIADFMGVSAFDITFGKSTTELINNVAKQLKHVLYGGTGDIVISDEEHNANHLPWKEWLMMYDLPNKLVILDYDEIPNHCVHNNVAIVSVAHTTNVSGVTRDLQKILEVKDDHFIFIVDGCQHAPHVDSLKVPAGVDMYVFSGHKLHAPKGIAVAYISSDFNACLRPFNFGGGIVDMYIKHDNCYLYDSTARKHLGGTQNTNDVITLANTLSLKNEFDFEFTKTLRKIFMSLTSDLDITVYNKDIDSTTVAFRFNTVDNYTALVGNLSDDYGFVSQNIMLRAGTMCNQLTMDKYDISFDGCLRISFSPYNTIDEVVTTVDVMKQIIKKHGGTDE